MVAYGEGFASVIALWWIGVTVAAIIAMLRSGGSVGE